MYHVELRQFPHNMSRFNLSDGELRALADRWVRNEPVEFGERRWLPQQAKLKILEGPRLELGQLTMGRGWRMAERDGEDVTVQVLDAARAAAGAPASPVAGAPASGASAPPADPLGLAVQLASLLGEQPTLLLDRWRTVAERVPALAPSESLAQAERELRESGH